MFVDTVLEEESNEHSHAFWWRRVIVLSQVGAHDAMLSADVKYGANHRLGIALKSRG